MGQFNFTYGPGAFRLTLAGAVFLSHVSRFDYGRPAVMLFFMLSGYWVALMQDSPHHQKYFSYLFSRLLRIWSQLAVTAIFVYAAYALVQLKEPGSLASTIALMGLATRNNDLVGTIWSLDIESQLYIVLPALLIAKSLFKNPIKFAALALASFAVGYATFVETRALTLFFIFTNVRCGYCDLFLPLANSSSRSSTISDSRPWTFNIYNLAAVQVF